MYKLMAFLYIAGIITTAIGIRFTDQGVRKMGIFLLIGGFVVMLLSQFTELELLPTT